MTDTYHVHLYREMRLSFEHIIADTPEAAAAIARARPTDEAESVDDCDGESLAALVDIVGDEAYSRSVMIEFEAERQRRAAATLLAACRMVVGRWERGDLAEAARACHAAVAMAIGECSPWDTTTGSTPYSVLLLYPDHANDGGTETYYAFVEAAHPIEAVAKAQIQAAEAQEATQIEPGDFLPLLAIEGHHAGLPMFGE